MRAGLMAKKAARFGAFVCTSVLLTVLFVEVILRIFPQLLPTYTKESIRTRHPYLTLWYKGSLETEVMGDCFRAKVEFNELGLRNPPMKDLQAKSRAWLFVGDSMVQGLQVDNHELFTSILQREYPDVAMINLSSSGASPIFYNKMLRYFLDYEKLHPNIERMYYFIFMGNDFDGLYSDPAKQRWIKRHLYWLRTYVVVNVVYRRILLAVAPDRVLTKEPFYLSNNTLKTRVLELMTDRLKELKEVASDHGIEAIVVLLASPLQMKEGESSQLYRFPVDNLKKIADGLGLKLYNAAETMMRHNEKNGLPYDHYVFKCDGHFNELGHRFMARVISASDAGADKLGERQIPGRHRGKDPATVLDDTDSAKQ